MTRRILRSVVCACVALAFSACANNSLVRRSDSELEPLTLKLAFLQSQLDLLRVDVRDLENEVAELQRQIAKLEAQ